MADQRERVARAMLPNFDQLSIVRQHQILDYADAAIAECRTDTEALVGALQALVETISYLIENSNGISGPHLNNDVAPWSELTEGGEFSPWLGGALEPARALLASLKTPETEGAE